MRADLELPVHFEGPVNGLAWETTETVWPNNIQRRDPMLPKGIVFAQSSEIRSFFSISQPVLRVPGSNGPMLMKDRQEGAEVEKPLLIPSTCVLFEYGIFSSFAWDRNSFFQPN